MTSFIRYRTVVPYSGYTWRDDNKLIPNEGEMKSNELPDNAYLEFLSTSRKVRGASNVEEKKDLIEDFTLKFGSLLSVEGIIELSNSDGTHPFFNEQSRELKNYIEDLYTKVSDFEEVGTKMLDFMSLHTEGDLGEVNKILQNISTSSMMRAEKVKGRIKTVFYVNTLAGALMYQLAMSMNQMGQLKICEWCGDPMEGKSNKLTCSVNCRKNRNNYLNKEEKNENN